MLRLGALFLCLLMSSLLAAATVHAQEQPYALTIANAPLIECSGVVHSEGDADQRQGDTDSAMPHHHGSCHGGAAFLPAIADTSGQFSPLSGRVPFPASAALARWLTGPDLRPPIA